jgi:hypothetical protein
MTLRLFGPGLSFENLLNDQPVLSGKHPVNLYLGTQAAQALAATGNGCCYDPAFQAGYPCTPIFNGSRLAQLFLLAGGADYRPEAYKLGLAIVCMLVPFLLLTAARAMGLSRGPAVLAVALGLLVWWSEPGQKALRTGDVELLVGGLAFLSLAAFLVRFHYAPTVGTWLALFAAGTVAWFGEPLLCPVFFPLGLAYYLTVGAKHRSLTWHLALGGGLLAGLAVNSYWLIDWVTFWWLRSPYASAGTMLPHRTLETLWAAPIWGTAADRTLAVTLLASAALGIGIMNQERRRPAARLLGLGAGGLLVLALLGVAWEPLVRLGSGGLLVPALWFAAVPAAFAWFRLVKLGLWWLGEKRAAVAICGLVAGIVVAGHATLLPWFERCVRPAPLTIGLGPEREALVEKLILHTGPEARILWEDMPLPADAPHWQALLPLLTGRSFVGGLDPEGVIEHALVGLRDQLLQDRPITAYSDVALEEYCRLYNIGWVVCWSPASAARLKQWKDGKKRPVASLVTALYDSAPPDTARAGATGSAQARGFLFEIHRDDEPEDNDRPRTFWYTLKGQAQVVHADNHHITLSDVVPENGVVLLSLHYQTGMRALPSRVQVEREPDAHDPIGFLRLRVAGAVARVTLTWDDR